MNVLIIGGTGILSNDLVKVSLDRGCTVYMLNRGRRKSLIDERAKLIIGDIREENVDSLIEKLNHCAYDVVVDFLTMNVSHLEKMMTILESINCRQYIFISSATGYITDGSAVITEQTPIGNKNWEYAYDKCLCEWRLKESSINYTIIRPYVTYSKTRIPFQYYPYEYYTIIKRIINDKPMPLVNGGKNRCTLTHTIDFANVMFLLFGNKKAFRQEFHITDSKAYTWEEVYLMLCKLLKKEPHIIDISLNEAKKMLPDYYKELSGDKAKNMVFSSKKVLDAVGGYDFCVSLEEGLRMSIDYFSSNKNAQKLSVNYDADLDYVSKRKIRRINLKPIAGKSLRYFVLSSNILRPLYYFFKRPNKK